MILKQTGATPTVPTDFRATTEKYADFEGMKILLESNLKSITNGMNASSIVAQLTPQEVSFATNAFPLIKETLSKRYALGVPADIAVQFIRDLQRKEAQTRGVEFGIQQSTGEGILLSAQQILNTLASVKDYDALRVIIQQAPASSVRSRALSEISQVSSLLPSAGDLNRLERIDPEVGSDLDEILNELLSDFPTSSQLQEAIDELQVAIRARDARATEQEIMDIMELISQSEETKTTLKTALQEIRRSPEESEQEEVRSEVSDIDAPAEEELLSSDDTAFLGMTISQKQQRIKVLLQQYPDLELANTSTGKANAGKPVNGDTSITNYPKGDANLTQLYYQIPQDKRALPSDPSSATTQETGTTEGKGIRRMKGCGLAKATPRVRKNRLEHLTDGVVERPKPYMPFGRFVIHKFDLEGGKLSMRTPKGGAVKELPSQKISMGLVRVLKTIGKGSLPSFDEIKGLAEGDKETLHKVITHSRLNDKVSVPTPQSKTDEEKLADRFDILKGEIVAGNDNRELVKEFKILLLKLLNAGRVPRKEAHDILTDLASIGL
jgi:hypothetical protein